MQVDTRNGNRGTSRWWGLVFVLLLLVGGPLGPSAPSPRALHGALRRSAPAKGAKLQRVPRELRLTFTEPVERAVARLTLLNPAGQPVPLGTVDVPPDSAAQLVAAINGGMTAGRYTVHWQIAGADGHPVRGEFTFDVAPGAVGMLAAEVAPVQDTVSRSPGSGAAQDTVTAGASTAGAGAGGMAVSDGGMTGQYDAECLDRRSPMSESPAGRQGMAAPLLGLERDD